jgi:hypothetical protein
MVFDGKKRVLRPRKTRKTLGFACGKQLRILTFSHFAEVLHNFLSVLPFYSRPIPLVPLQFHYNRIQAKLQMQNKKNLFLFAL